MEERLAGAAELPATENKNEEGGGNAQEARGASTDNALRVREAASMDGVPLDLVPGAERLLSSESRAGACHAAGTCPVAQTRVGARRFHETSPGLALTTAALQSRLTHILVNVKLYCE